MNYTELYQKALQYIQKEQLEKAKHCLQEILQEMPNDVEVRWAMGLIEVLSGFPHLALKHWQSLKEDDKKDLPEKVQQVEQQLPLYEKLYHDYNKGLQYIQEDNLQEATAIFKELLSFKKKVPLPAEFYKGYLLLLVLCGDESKVENELAALPTYVKTSTHLSEFEKYFKLYQSYSNHGAQLDSASENKSQQRKFPFFLTSSAVIMAVLVTFFVTNSLQNNQAVEIEPETNAQIALTDEAATYKQQAESLTEELSNLKEHQIALQAELSSKTEELEQQSKVEELIELSDIDLAKVSLQAGLEAYRKGLKAYKSGDYPSAISTLQQSYTLQSETYFSDDALYYLIKSKEAVNDQTMMDEINIFLQSENIHYSQSPYFDDLLLLKAKNLAVSNQEEALHILNTLLENHAEEWTGREAAIMKAQLEL